MSDFLALGGSALGGWHLSTCGQVALQGLQIQFLLARSQRGACAAFRLYFHLFGYIVDSCARATLALC